MKLKLSALAGRRYTLVNDVLSYVTLFAQSPAEISVDSRNLISNIDNNIH